MTIEAIGLPRGSFGQHLALAVVIDLGAKSFLAEPKDLAMHRPVPS
jgi:hypothetical protein